MKSPVETVTARVYRQHGEKSAHALRATVEGTGLKVSCPSDWRDSWIPGQVIQFTGRVVGQNCGSPYFKARAFELLTSTPV
jgi:hypothetical protein